MNAWKYFLVVLVLFSCTDSQHPENLSIDLLSLPQHNSRPVIFANFNKQILNATAAQESWATNPILITHRFINVPSGHTIIMALNKIDKDIETTHQAILIVDKVPDDDSVRGYRYDITLRKNQKGIWEITRASESWRCWEDRGHKDFDAKPCL